MKLRRWTRGMHHSSRDCRRFGWWSEMDRLPAPAARSEVGRWWVCCRLTTVARFYLPVPFLSPDIHQSLLVFSPINSATMKAAALLVLVGMSFAAAFSGDGTSYSGRRSNIRPCLWRNARCWTTNWAGMGSPGQTAPPTPPAAHRRQIETATRQFRLDRCTQLSIALFNLPNCRAEHAGAQHCWSNQLAATALQLPQWSRSCIAAPTSLHQPQQSSHDISHLFF